MDKTKANKYEIDMINGPILKKMLLFSFPLMLSSVLQLLFNAADIIVVGQFAGADSLAAVGSTTSIIHLITNMFIGMSVGANVVISKYFGARQKYNLSESVHTSLLFSVACGFVLAIVGILLSKPILLLTSCPSSIIDKANLYMIIYFIGIPSMMIYNFGAAILRSVGDTKRPLYFLSISGVLNIILNLFFVISLKLDVAGVAIATSVSNLLSAVLIIVCLIKSDGDYRLEIKKLKIHKDKLIQILKFGVPSGIQGMCFSVSNVIIQSAVNSFGLTVIAGSTASSSIEGFVYVAMDAFYYATLSFVGQNFGAKNFKRINRIYITALMCVTVTGIVLGSLAVIFSNPLISIFNKDPEVISFGAIRLLFVCAPYFLCGIMEVAAGVLRGIGSSIAPTISTLAGVCGFRIIWIFTVFKVYHTYEILFLSYPISWLIAFTSHMIIYFFIHKKIFNKYKSADMPDINYGN